MADEPKRASLSVAEVALMFDLLPEAPSHLRGVAERVARGEVVKQAEADELAEVLTTAMLDQEYDEDNGLTRRGADLDRIIGVVYQMSEDFFR